MGKIVDLADESSNNGQMSDTEDFQDDKNDQEIKKEKIILSTDFCTYQLTDIKPISDRHDSTETLSKLSKSNLGKMFFLFFSNLNLYLYCLPICFIFFFSYINISL